MRLLRWFRAKVEHPCQIVFIRTNTEYNGEIWCNTHLDFYVSAPDDGLLVSAGSEHAVSVYGSTPPKFALVQSP